MYNVFIPKKGGEEDERTQQAHSDCYRYTGGNGAGSKRTSKSRNVGIERAPEDSHPEVPISLD